MHIFSYIHKSVELLFQILGLVEGWTHRSIVLSPSKGSPSQEEHKTGFRVFTAFESALSGPNRHNLHNKLFHPRTYSRYLSHTVVLYVAVLHYTAVLRGVVSKRNPSLFHKTTRRYQWAVVWYKATSYSMPTVMSWGCRAVLRGHGKIGSGSRFQSWCGAEFWCPHHARCP